MKLGAVAARGGAWNVLVALGSQATTFLVFLVLARVLSVEDIGAITIASALLNILWFFVEQGYGTALVQKRDASQRAMSTVFWIVVMSSIVAVVLVSLLAPFIASTYDSPELTAVLRVMVWAMAISSLNAVHLAILQRDLRFRAQAVVRFVSIFLGGAVGISMALADFGIWSLVGKHAVEGVSAVILSVAFVRWKPGLEFDRAEAKTLFSFGSQVRAAQLLNTINRRIGDFILGAILGPVGLGYFAVASRAQSLVSEVTSASFLKTATPIMCRIQASPDQLRAATRRGLELGAAILPPIFAGIAVTAPEILELFFGAKWLPAAGVLRSLACLGVFNTVGLLTRPLLIATGRADWLLKISAFGMVLRAVAIAVGAQFGLQGVAIGLLIPPVVLVPFNLYLLKTFGGITRAEVIKLQGRPGLATLAMALLVLLVSSAGLSNLPVLPRLLLMASLGGLSYPLLLFLLARSSFDRVFQMARVWVPSRSRV